VKEFIKQVGLDNMRPGDVLVTNTAVDPTGHLNDITVAKPIFRTAASWRSPLHRARARHRRQGALGPSRARWFSRRLPHPRDEAARRGKPDATLIKLPARRRAHARPDRGRPVAQITGSTCWSAGSAIS